MDAWGPDECERRIDEILGWLQEEANDRGMPFIKLTARLAVKAAIAASRSD